MWSESLSTCIATEIGWTAGNYKPRPVIMPEGNGWIWSRKRYCIYFSICIIILESDSFPSCFQALCLSEALLGCLPVHNIPYSIEVFGLAVLVLETVIMISIVRSSLIDTLTSRHAPRHRFLAMADICQRLGPGLRMSGWQYCQSVYPSPTMPIQIPECQPEQC